MINFKQTFDPSAIYDINKIHPYYLCELMLNNIPILHDVFMLDSVDTPEKTWTPYSEFNSKMVEARGKLITADNIDNWAEDFKHGIVHSFFVALWATYLLNRERGRDMVQLLHTIDQDFIDLFYSCIMHDFSRGFVDDPDHAKRLKKHITNCIPVTYRHTYPEPEDCNHPLVVADRIELMRFGIDYADHSVYEGVLSESELHMFHFFYNNIRPQFHKAWIYRKDPFVTHFIQNVQNWNYDTKTFPCKENKEYSDTCCVFVRPNILEVEEINNRYFFYGIIPLEDVKGIPKESPHEHPAFELGSMNNIDEWIFLYTIPNVFQQEMVKHGRYAIRSDILMSFVNLVEQIYSNVMINLRNDNSIFIEE